MRLAIGMEVLILRLTWFYERRTTTMKSIFVFAYYYHFAMDSE